MEQNIIDTNTENIELLTASEVCELMNIKSSTFFRYYCSKLTGYKNADRTEDKKHYFDKDEVLDLLQKREKAPTRVVVARRISND